MKIDWHIGHEWAYRIQGEAIIKFLSGGHQHTRNQKAGDVRVLTTIEQIERCDMAGKVVARLDTGRQI